MTRELRILAECETDLCHALVFWMATHGRNRVYARWSVASAVLACRMARGAVAQARRELQMRALLRAEGVS